MLRDMGAPQAIATVEAWHRLEPAAAQSGWHPEALANMDTPEWRQLYVNAEHDGSVGVITIARESYSWDVDRELNRALDWLKAEQIRRVIVSGDFHIATQMVGADTAEFFPALTDLAAGLAITNGWSATARRLNDEFDVSVAFVGGKRCLGGMLETVMHCHYVVAVEDARFGWPEVTLPVVPGMAGEAVGWLIDAAAPMEQALALTWSLASGGAKGVTRRPLAVGKLEGVPTDAGLPAPDGPAETRARAAIVDCVQRSCGVPLTEALPLQAKIAAEFLASAACREGRVGAEAARTLNA
jgi:enoyl-CoA hydratase/carnithine racemase